MIQDVASIFQIKFEAIDLFKSFKIVENKCEKHLDNPFRFFADSQKV